MDIEKKMQNLKDLEGEQFEKEYLDAMIEHHRMGMAMMRLAKEKARNEELLDLTDDMIEDHSEEIEDMEEMRGGTE